MASWKQVKSLERFMRSRSLAPLWRVVNGKPYLHTLQYGNPSWPSYSIWLVPGRPVIDHEGVPTPNIGRRFSWPDAYEGL